MKRCNIILVLVITLILIFSANSYATEDKTILILLDELSLNEIQNIVDKDFGVGFVNIRTREPYGNESFYFSTALGRKIGVESKYYRGLYKDQDGRINIAGFNDMFDSISNGTENMEDDLIGEKLKDEGISYIGDNSSAIVAADNQGHVKSGEIEIEYNKEWLIDKTNLHLSDSNILVLSYDINQYNNRITLLKDYIKEYKGTNIMIVSEEVPQDMNNIINNHLTPILYINSGNNGIGTSSSTKREGFMVLEDIYGELLSIYNKNDGPIIGNKIEIEEKEDNIDYAKNLFQKTNNLMLITYIFHGLLYFVQCYCAYLIYKNKYDKLEKVHYLNIFIIINIVVSLLMGASNYHVNIVLYLSINLLISYIITSFMYDRETNIIGLFSTITYALIIMMTVFFPENIYNFYIGFNNLFYGARYYGFNNGMMGVVLASSIVSYLFIKDLIKNDFVSKLIFLFFACVDILILSARFGANTGGFLAALVLLLIIVYTKFLKGEKGIKIVMILVLMGVVIFSLNMYFDFLNGQKSHAINFFIRISQNGITELLSMIGVKIMELVKFTLLPPFSIVIVAQLVSLKFLSQSVDKNFIKETSIIFFIAVVAFLINDTGNIAFIFMCHYLISLLVKKYLDINMDIK
ncbi:hypothetical protein K8M07_04485 [Schnuerera sp. xch1]|uniref:hypothetical protein n=1 Tax=Schnuerera sp. xch1 TaxID=2874283 RepID=UPI001CC1685A|nr:hypothetical protein [Schnuerera sp. xch1]MBZ2174498.1 hypothetical protein [Schnuerera sp. xch1]